MSDLVLRLARPGEDARIADFINQNFDMRLPLINRADFYQFYYAHTPGAAPQFALAEQDGEILCAAGYILANQSETPDIWVSVWVAAKGHNGVGLELMDALSGLLNARVVACNNIRANTCVLYHFLVGSFSLKANAEGLASTLKSAGYDAQIALNTERNMYRVVASTFADKAAAVKSRNQLRAGKYPDAWLLLKK